MATFMSPSRWNKVDEPPGVRDTTNPDSPVADTVTREPFVIMTLLCHYKRRPTEFSLARSCGGIGERVRETGSCACRVRLPRARLCVWAPSKVHAATETCSVAD